MSFERNRLRTDLATAVLVASLLYPLPVHWCWHEQGFLAQRYLYSYHHKTSATRLIAYLTWSSLFGLYRVRQRNALQEMERN